MTKFLNISTDNTLGGNSSSDELVSSQKAVKDYVDNNSGSTTLSGLTDTTISSPSDGQVLTYDSSTSKWVNGFVNINLVENITYSSLYSLFSNGTLTPGMVYRITDYVTTTTEGDTTSEGNLFDLLVFAESNDKLNHRAIAIHSPRDINNYFIKNNLEKWKVWYDIENNKELYRWADSNNGKGVIYRLIDEFDNEAPYDFKNIKFTVTESGTTYSQHTFSTVPSSSTKNSQGDISLNGEYCYNNKVYAYNDSGVFKLPFNRILLITGNIASSNVFCADSHNTQLFFGTNIIGNVIGLSSYSCEITGSYNKIGDNSASISFTGDNNTVGIGCSSVIIEGHDNKIGNSSSSIALSGYSHYNIIGDNVSGVNFSQEDSYNIIEQNCSNIKLYDGCYSVTIEQVCSNITIGATKSVRYKNIIIEKENDGLTLTSSIGSGFLQNVLVAEGAITSATNITTISRGNAFRTTVARKTDGTLRIYNEDDCSILPNLTGNAGMVLAVNSGATDVEWVSQSGDTVTGKTVTLGTTGSAVIQVNGVDSGSVSLPSGSTSAAGIVQLTDSTSSTSTTTAATPNSVKSAYDLASGAIPKSTGTTAGDIIYYTGASTPTRLAKGTAGQVLTMNSGATAPEWQTPTTGSTTLAGLTDTTVSSPTDGQVLTYDNGTSKWINAAVPTEIPSQSGQSGKFLTTNGTAVSWAVAPTELPSVTGNASKVLAVNSGATGVEWVTPSSGGLTDYNFTHTTNTTVTSPFTFTCTANQRNSQMITTSANLTLNITCNNGSDNYLWVKNSSSSADIDVVIGTVTYNGNTVSASSIYLPSDGITVPKSGLCEIGIIMNADGAFITVRSDLAPSV